MGGAEFPDLWRTGNGRAALRHFRPCLLSIALSERKRRDEHGRRLTREPGMASDASDSSDDDANLPPEVLERRRRAIHLLAKAMHKPSGEPLLQTDPATSAAADVDAETRFLTSLLTTKPSEILRCVRDRLSVLSVTKGGVKVTATKRPVGQQQTSANAATSPDAAATVETDEASDGGESESRLPEVLRRLEAGDVTLVSASVLSPDYWAALVRERIHDSATRALLLREDESVRSSETQPDTRTVSSNPVAVAAAAAAAACAGTVVAFAAVSACRLFASNTSRQNSASVATAAAAAVVAAASAASFCTRVPFCTSQHAGKRRELCVPDADLQAMRASLHARGYGSLKPGSESWGWSELTPVLGALCAAADAFRDAGWPPAFIFVLPGAWRLIDRLFTPLEALLGSGCEMDPSVFCWIARRPQESTDGSKAKAGANFGVPHRDFTCLQSLRKVDGAPALLSVWLPLNRVTTENGCMMVVPRQLDPHFGKRWACLCAWRSRRPRR